MCPSSGLLGGLGFWFPVHHLESTIVWRAPALTVCERVFLSKSPCRCTLSIVLHRSLCGQPRKFLHLLEVGHNHPIVRFAYLWEMFIRIKSNKKTFWSPGRFLWLETSKKICQGHGQHEMCLYFLGQNAVGFCVRLVVEWYGICCVGCDLVVPGSSGRWLKGFVEVEKRTRGRQASSGWLHVLYSWQALRRSRWRQCLVYVRCFVGAIPLSARKKKERREREPPVVE